MNGEEILTICEFCGHDAGENGCENPNCFNAEK